MAMTLGASARQRDRIAGTLLMILGALVCWRAASFPSMAGMAYGPGLFPTIAAWGMMACGALILLSARRRDRPSVTATADEAQAAAPTAASNIRPGPWRGIALLALVALYAVVLEPLGFLVATPPLVALSACLYGLRPVQALVLAAVLTALVHALFYSLLHVPLPWGLLTPIAW
ncbi:tripartite tricarboxylate transporter TctB family protein [uncultured Salinicola sp.]|uniref:tripartite tricarboxylate transporter TctB family protein n=1 Tax=uncultured Salinicola sp. TaxID=1193542 RepID=UPI00262E7EBF|nr:tripartite tricarboxylate transporter TctB family protein [uncultured Salinicola sp.]|tara:strand:+ start:744 stop:1265 length:522 start_codon:yes stop_codon:yes gene_type:complete